MKKICFSCLLFLSCYSIQAQAPCQLSLDSIYLDTALSDCSHLFFKYNISGGNASIYHWTYGDGNSCACIKPKNIYRQNGNFTVCGRIEDINGCVDSLCVSFTVFCSNPCDLSGIGIYSADTLSYSCNEIEFICITSNNAKKIRWDFGDGDSANSKYIIHTFEKNGNYRVRLIVQDSIACADTADISIDINCPVTAPCDFKVLSMDTATGVHCRNKHFEISTSHTPKTIRWQYGDGNSEFNGLHAEHTYADTGKYEVCVYAEDSFNCRDTFCLDLQVKCQNPSSLHHFRDTEVKMYPSPFTGSIHIETQSDAEIIIYDLLFRELQREKIKGGNTSLDLSYLETGSFIILYRSETLNEYFRMIKQ